MPLKSAKPKPIPVPKLLQPPQRLGSIQLAEEEQLAVPHHYRLGLISTLLANPHLCHTDSSLGQMTIHLPVKGCKHHTHPIPGHQLNVLQLEVPHLSSTLHRLEIIGAKQVKNIFLGIRDNQKLVKTILLRIYLTTPNQLNQMMLFNLQLH